MKKFFKQAIVTVLTAAVTMFVATPAFASDATNTVETNVPIAARIVNLETGDIINLTAKEVVEIATRNRATISVNDSESKTVGVKVTAQLPQSRLTDGDSVTGGGVDAYLYVDYTTKTVSGSKYIRVDKIRGSWNPSSSYITISGRAVDYGDGQAIGGNEGHKAPTSNSFSYTTGWDYTLYTPATDYSGARAYSCATASMSGGSNYLLECFVRVDSL